MRLVCLSPIVFLVACGSDAASADDPQAPPTTGHTAVEAWLAKRYYTGWACEPAVHAARSPSPHGFNKICSNDLVAANVGGSGPWPVGAAAVKELYADANATTPVGIAVYVKRAADSADGANWYWYERVPLDKIGRAHV